MGKYRVTLDDIQYSTWNLFRLLDTVVEQMLELDYGPPDNHNRALDRVASLVMIARDVAEKTAEEIDENYHDIRKAAIIPDDVLAIGAEVEALQRRVDERRQSGGSAA